MTGEPDPIALLQRNSSLDSLMFFLGFFLGEHSLTIPVVSDAEDRPFVGALKAEAVDGLAGNFSRVDQRKIKSGRLWKVFGFRDVPECVSLCWFHVDVRRRDQNRAAYKPLVMCLSSTSNADETNPVTAKSLRTG